MVHEEMSVSVATTKLICLDADKRLWVTAGFPCDEDGNLTADVVDEMQTSRNTPYVFIVDTLNVQDADHKGMGVDIQQVPVIMGHASWRENVWTFANGQPVDLTVEGYNRYAKEQNLPPIEFIVACNRFTDSSGIKVREMTGRIAARAVGEPIELNTLLHNRIRPKGNIELAVKAEGRVVGLNGLLVARSIAPKHQS